MDFLRIKVTRKLLHCVGVNYLARTHKEKHYYYYYYYYHHHHHHQLNDLYPSPNIVRVIKSRRMGWAGYVAHMGEDRGCIGSWMGNRRERDPTGET